MATSTFAAAPCAPAARLRARAQPRAAAAAARYVLSGGERVVALRTKRGPSAARTRSVVRAATSGFDLEALVASFPNPFDTRKTVIITGASSGLGKATTEVLANSGKWHVIMACRDVKKAQRVAEELELPKGSFSVMECDLDSLAATASFADAVLKSGRRIDVLCCNAALYLPNQAKPSFTKDGYETSFGVNHLAHHLLVRKLLPALAKTKGSRCVIVGSITGNSNTVGGGAVLPLADLGGLKGLMGPSKGKQVPMLDAKEYNGAKAYKDAKLCNMMTVLELHRRYHVETGVSFTSMYPGCIAETALFRQKRGWFRWFFPIFMKYVTGGYVSEAEAGERLAETIGAPATAKSGVYWSWNGGARTVGWYDFKAKGVVGSGGSGGELFENEPSGLVTDKADAKVLFEFCDAAIAPFTSISEPNGKAAPKMVAA